MPYACKSKFGFYFGTELIRARSRVCAAHQYFESNFDVNAKGCAEHSLWRIDYLTVLSKKSRTDNV